MNAHEWAVVGIMLGGIALCVVAMFAMSLTLIVLAVPATLGGIAWTARA